MTCPGVVNRRLLLLGLLALSVPGAASAKGKRKSSGRRRGGGGRGRVSSGGGDASFSSCKEARANGYSRIRRGEPGYSARLDRDGEACE